MVILKKLIFALPFLISFLAFINELNIFIQDTNLIFSLNQQVLIQSAFLLLYLLLTSLFFVIFLSLALDFQLVLPVILISSLSVLLSGTGLGELTLAGTSFLNFSLIYLVLRKKFLSYLIFSPTALLLPSIKQTLTLILLASSLIYYLSARTEIKQNGFQIPPSLLDLSLKFNPLENQSLPEQPQNSLLQQLQISPEQLKLLKQNPDLLKKYGLDPALLDSLEKGTNTTIPSSLNEVMKQTIQNQVQTIVKPYLYLIPIIYTLTFYFSFSSLASLLAIFLSPIVWIIFYLMEKTGFTKYEVEQREVKKLVV